MPIIPRRDAYIWAKPIWQLNEAEIDVIAATEIPDSASEAGVAVERAIKERGR